jgi:phosphoribosylformimino-5-aminoimidazole carboxamide ribotide isomerase
MIVIPAIDLRNGQCVRLLQGDYGRETVFGQDAVGFARRFESEGARRLHVVDLDGAKAGIPSERHWEIVSAIVAAVSIPIQLGGGIRSLDTATRALALGVDRVIVGTAIVGNRQLAGELFQSLGDRVIAGIDARDGRVAVEGWTGTTELDAPAFASEMEQLGARRIVFTDIARDGMETGPNLASLTAVAGAVSIPVIASGGIGSPDDIRALVRSAPGNVEGVIVGRALYSGSLTLRMAMEVAHAGS